MQQLKIDRMIYGVDDKSKTYQILRRNPNWKKLSQAENEKNKKHIDGYTRQLLDKRKMQYHEPKKLLVQLLRENPKILLKNLASENTILKYSSQKALMQMAKTNPAKIYPYFDEFVGQLSSKNNFIKWGAIRVIADLVPVDKAKKFDKVFKKYYSLILDKSMVAASNVVASSGVILQARPDLSKRIFAEIFKFKKGHYTKECKNIITGHLIKMLDLAKIKPDKMLLDFVKQAAKNTRHATAVKARKYLGELSKK